VAAVGVCGADAARFKSLCLSFAFENPHDGARRLNVSVSMAYFGPGIERTHEGTASPEIMAGFPRILQLGGIFLVALKALSKSSALGPVGFGLPPGDEVGRLPSFILRNECVCLKLM